MAAITANTGANNWNTNAAWVGSVQPTAADDVTVPASATVTIPTAVTALARSVTIQASGTVAWATTTSVLTIGDATAGAGNVAFSNAGNITLTGVGTINFVSTNATQQTITTGGKTLPNVNFNGLAGSWKLTDTNTMTIVELIIGTFDTGNQTCTWTGFRSDRATNNYTFNMGSSTITLTGFCAGTTIASVGNPSAGTGVINASTSTIISTVAGNGFFSNLMTTANQFNNLSFTGAGLILIRINQCKNLTRTGTAATGCELGTTQAFTVTGDLTITGNSTTNFMLVDTYSGAYTKSAGTNRTITVSGAVYLTNVHVQDITAAGAGLPFDATRGGVDLGNNVSWIFPQTLTYSTNGSYLWTCPVGVTTIQVNCWGAGGGGGGYGSSDIGTPAGGGGGGYSQSTVSVTPGTIYTVTVGAAGTAGSNSGGTGTRGGLGGDSWFNTSATILAKGGGGGFASVDSPTVTGGAGGASGSGIGTIRTAGGNGGAGNGNSAGGGGGGGGSGGDTTGGGVGQAAPASAGGTAGAAGTTNGALGGVGGTSASTIGNPGVAPGGGGGGGGNNNATNRNGGAGAIGQVKIIVTGIIGHDIQDSENSPGAMANQAPQRAAYF